jgi:hypothetical protein
MVPSARTAHFDHVAGKVAMLAGKGRQFRLFGNAPSVRWKPGAKHVRNVNERLGFAYRTRFRGRFPKVFRRPEQLGVRIAHIDPGKTPALVFSNQMATNQAKVNRSRPTFLDTAHGVSSKRHSGEATSTGDLSFVFAHLFFGPSVFAPSVFAPR